MAYSLDDAFSVTLPVRGKSSSRRGQDVRLGIFHTAEGARTVQSLASWFNNPAARASSHAGADDRHLSRMVPESQSAWTASKANPIATQIELCGFARWSAAEWREHPGMLENAARWAAAVSVYHGIPLVRVPASKVRTGRGFCMHYDITVGWPTGSHTDCGAPFKEYILDGILDRARQIVAAGTHAAGAAPVAPTPEGDWFDMATQEDLQRVIDKALEPIKNVQRDHTGKLDRIFETGRVTDDRVNRSARAQVGADRTRQIVQEVAGALPEATVDALVERLTGEAGK